MSDIDTGVVDSLKVLDPDRPIREADIGGLKSRNAPVSGCRCALSCGWQHRRASAAPYSDSRIQGPRVRGRAVRITFVFRPNT